MAKESMKAREVKRAKLVAKYAEKRAALKKIVNSGDPAEAFEAAAGSPVLTICFNAALFSAYLATNLARFTSRAFIDSFAIIYQSFLAFLNGKPNSFNKA